MTTTTLFNRISALAASLAILLLAAPAAKALPADTYTDRSVLADGRWVRVAVASSGLVRISDTELRRMGFADPSAVRVYGYGGARIPERLDSSTYVDDLPQAVSARSSGPTRFRRYSNNEKNRIPGGVRFLIIHEL